MLLINKYDYLLQRPEIKTLLHIYDIKEISVIDGKIYQLGVGLNSLFFNKEQLENLVVAKSTLICSQHYTHWEFYLKELSRLFILWRLQQKFFLLSNFNLLCDNHPFFTPFSFMFSAKKRKTKLKFLAIGRTSLRIFSDKFLVYLWKPRFYHLRKQFKRGYFKRHKYLRRLMRRWRELQFRRFKNKWSYLFVALFLYRSFFTAWPLRFRLSPLKIQQNLTFSLFLQRRGYLDNFNFTSAIFSYIYFFFSITFWRFFKKIRKKVKRQKLFLNSINIDALFFEQLFNYWFFFIIGLLTKLTNLNAYLAWYFSVFQCIYLSLYLGKHYALRKRWRPYKKFPSKMSAKKIQRTRQA